MIFLPISFCGDGPKEAVGQLVHSLCSQCFCVGAELSPQTPLLLLPASDQTVGRFSSEGRRSELVFSLNLLGLLLRIHGSGSLFQMKLGLIFQNRYISLINL